MGFRAFVKRLFNSGAQTIVTPVRGTYDASRTTDHNSNYWANADSYDADSANSKEVRSTLVKRSRYEINNNGYADGIAQTYATDLVGVGPSLRMQTGSTGFNRLVETEWYNWTKAIQWRRKLWCMAHAKYSDGEAFAVLRRNPRVAHALPLDVVLYETEQFQTPYLSVTESGHIDGIKFDEFGNPLWFDVLRQHPGATGVVYDTDQEQVPAAYVLHWFKLRRPGQHRGVPESASTLNTGAAARRWREATLASAETAADFSVFLRTNFQPDQIASVTPMSTLSIQKRMMTALPEGWSAEQMQAQHPNATFEAFHDQLINEQARPISMPKNKAKCDSSQYNYASGRLDHQTYYAALDVERRDADDLVLDPLFRVWFDLSILTFSWLGGNPDAVNEAARSHLWDWPKHRVADVEAEANANRTKLESGQIGLHQLYSDSGFDLEDEIAKMAASFGVTEDDIRRRLLDTLLPSTKPQPTFSQPPDRDADTGVAALLARLGGTNGRH